MTRARAAKHTELVPLGTETFVVPHLGLQSRIVWGWHRCLQRWRLSPLQSSPSLPVWDWFAVLYLHHQ